MINKEVTTDNIADALINISENMYLCDKETAIGFKTSKKRAILKSKNENSFSKFTNEIKKRQSKKDWEDIDSDN